MRGTITKYTGNVLRCTNGFSMFTEFEECIARGLEECEGQHTCKLLHSLGIYYWQTTGDYPKALKILTEVAVKVSNGGWSNYYYVELDIIKLKRVMSPEYDPIDDLHCLEKKYSDISLKIELHLLASKYYIENERGEEIGKEKFFQAIELENESGIPGKIQAYYWRMMERYLIKRNEHNNTIDTLCDLAYFHKSRQPLD